MRGRNVECTGDSLALTLTHIVLVLVAHSIFSPEAFYTLENAEKQMQLNI